MSIPDRFLGRRDEASALPDGTLPFLEMVGIDKAIAGTPLAIAIDRLSIDTEEGQALAWLRTTSFEAVTFVIEMAGIPNHPYRVPPSILARNPNTLHPWLLACAPLLRTAQLSGRDIVEQIDAYAMAQIPANDRYDWEGRVAKAFYENPGLEIDKLIAIAD